MTRAAILSCLVIGVVLTIVVSGQNAAPPSAGTRGAANAATLPAPTGAVMPTRSPRNANYTIAARLDPSTRALTASETIVWRNITANPTRELQFHVYWNAWRNAKSTFLRERALLRTPFHDDEDFARVDIKKLIVHQRSSGQEAESLRSDRTAQMTFIAPDDGNQDDTTVMLVPLAEPAMPGDTVRIELDWTARVPKPFARTGYIGSFYFFAQWFPKLGVLEDTGWNCHQFHANTEFFSDFGVYDVKLTVPTRWRVGGTGVARAETENGDGTTTHSYYQEDVHDFAWTTSPTMIERTADFEPDQAVPPSSSGSRQGPVRIRLLLQPEHAPQADAHIEAARAALKYLSRWAGPYPYDQLTVIDPAYQSEADGMEYPTLITAGTPWLAASRVTINTPHEVVLHEAGHQFFYGIVASNEFEDAWMDEGITTYLAARALVQDHPRTYYEQRFFGNFVPWVFRDLEVSRDTYWNRLPGYRRTPETDLPSHPSFRYSVSGGRMVTYSKTALWLNTLERHLGWPTMERVLQTYFDRWQFKHPKPADFFAVANEVAGQDLMWFFDQVYRSSNAFDYAIDTLKSVKEGDVYRTDVIVSRNGGAVFPVDVTVTLENGETIKERWDGQDRWKHYTFTRSVRATSAVVDPDRVLLLDVDVTNNSKTIDGTAGRTAATKWSLKWLVWFQDSLLSWAFFV